MLPLPARLRRPRHSATVAVETVVLADLVCSGHGVQPIHIMAQTSPPAGLIIDTESNKTKKPPKGGFFFCIAPDEIPYS